MRILFVPAALCFIAIFSLPYGYYTFMRLVVTGLSLYAAFNHSNKDEIQFWILLGIAVLFNPLIPIHLSRAVWMPIDIITGGYFAYLAKK
jgi:hypothetical protein